MILIQQSLESLTLMLFCGLHQDWLNLWQDKSRLHPIENVSLQMEILNFTFKVNSHYKEEEEEYFLYCQSKTS